MIEEKNEGSLENFVKMEQNLPFLTFPLADKAYNKAIIPFLGKLDDGNIFKSIIGFILSALAILCLVGGVYLTISELFGDLGFIELYIGQESLPVGQVIGSILGLVFGFGISLLTSWALYSILKKRNQQMKAIEYDGLIDYVFIKVIPKLILAIGELMFILFLYVGILQIIAALVGAPVFAPLSNLPGLILMLFPGMEVFSDLIPRSIAGDYDYFSRYIQAGFSMVVFSFIVLIAFYIYKEIYNYLIKLITNLIAFLPKFGIPLAIRKRDENRQQINL